MTLGIGNVRSWRNAFLESVQELSGSFLGGAEVVVTGDKQELPYALLGAFVQVVCPEGPVLLGITGTSAACQGLARLMLSMEPNDPIEELDANDAVGELINIVAGLVKTKLSHQLGNIELGLPLFLSGRLRAIGRIAVESTEVKIGPYPCELVVFALTGR